MKKTKRSYDKICQICNESFIAGNNSAKYCPSKLCKREGRNRIDRKKRGPIPDIICDICQKSFPSSSPSAKYCGDDCKAEGARRKNKERHNKAKAKKKPKIYNRTCEICDEEFETTHHRRKFHLDCQREGRNKRRREHARKKKENGICAHCYIRPLAKDKSACNVCLKAANKCHKKLRDERIEQNLCRECGEIATRGNMCEKHASEIVIRNQKNYLSKKDCGLCTNCNTSLPEDYNHFMCRNCLDFRSQQNFEFKIKIMSHYGGGQCQCCSEKIIHFLSIDHINENGAEHRKTIGERTGVAFYKWLKNNGYPAGYQVLCHNCNTGKHINKGICPHVKKIYSYVSDVIKLKLETLAHYGENCTCCGEQEILFLTIDHINNDGAAHRREINSSVSITGHAFRVWLRTNGYPSGFQTRCQNCNHGKHINGGVCPHKNLVY